MFAVGQVILGGVAWLVQPWRYLIMALHIPCFLIVLYYWVLSESVRWLLSKDMFVEARVVLERVAKVNKKEISEKSMQALMTPAPVPENQVFMELKRLYSYLSKISYISHERFSYYSRDGKTKHFFYTNR